MYDWNTICLQCMYLGYNQIEDRIALPWWDRNDRHWSMEDLLLSHGNAQIHVHDWRYRSALIIISITLYLWRKFKKWMPEIQNLSKGLTTILKPIYVHSFYITGFLFSSTRIVWGRLKENTSGMRGWISLNTTTRFRRGVESLSQTNLTKI